MTAAHAKICSIIWSEGFRIRVSTHTLKEALVGITIATEIKLNVEMRQSTLAINRCYVTNLLRRGFVFCFGFFRSFQAGQSLFWVSSKFSGGIVAGYYPYAG